MGILKTVKNYKKPEKRSYSYRNGCHYIRQKDSAAFLQNLLITERILWIYKINLRIRQYKKIMVKAISEMSQRYTIRRIKTKEMSTIFSTTRRNVQETHNYPPNQIYNIDR